MVKRTFAWLVDSSLLWVAMAEISVIFGLGDVVQSGGSMAIDYSTTTSFPAYSPPTSDLILLALSAAYVILSWHLLGGTPIQRLFGLRVIGSSGQKLGLRASILRWFAMFGWIPIGIAATYMDYRGATLIVSGPWLLILLYTATADEQRRGLHDRIAGSFVTARTSDFYSHWPRS
jgi:hypothetical protein